MDPSMVRSSSLFSVILENGLSELSCAIPSIFASARVTEMSGSPGCSAARSCCWRNRDCSLRQPLGRAHSMVRLSNLRPRRSLELSDMV
ncbi:hypothetical protein BDV93DRAFT_528659 [Ceratobasidium sp. AG-I]|nr:hypothetical protein BDV93DRAFT_528659 [Ceratobasidium sp. AG-I]